MVDKMSAIVAMTREMDDDDPWFARAFQEAMRPTSWAARERAMTEALRLRNRIPRVIRSAWWGARERIAYRIYPWESND